MGVARQYCGRLGKVSNCQAGMFLAYVSPLGRALVDKRLYLPEKTEFETEQSDVGLDEYETRTWAGWHHHVALCRAGNRIGGK